MQPISVSFGIWGLPAFLCIHSGSSRPNQMFSPLCCVWRRSSCLLAVWIGTWTVLYCAFQHLHDTLMHFTKFLIDPLLHTLECCCLGKSCQAHWEQFMVQCLDQLSTHGQLELGFEPLTTWSLDDWLTEPQLSYFCLHLLCAFLNQIQNSCPSFAWISHCFYCSITYINTICSSAYMNPHRG